MAGNRVEIILQALNGFETVFGQLKTEIAIIRRDLATVGGAGSRAGAQAGESFRAAGGHVHGATQQVGFFSSAIMNATMQAMMLQMAVGLAMRAADALVFRFASTMESATLGIASAYLSGGQYVDAITGKVLQGQAALASAQADAKAMVQELQVANFQTMATLDQLVRGFQETLPVAMATGFNREQAKEFTVAMIQAAGAIDASGQLMHQLGEETRSLLLGTINPRTSRIATVLGLRNEDIAEFKGNAQGLFDFLMKRLEAYRAAGIASQQTWAGLLSNTKDILAQGSAKAFEPLFEGAKKGLSEFSKSILTIDEQTKTIVWNPEFLAGTERLKENVRGAVGAVTAVGGALIEHRGLIGGLVQAYVGLKASVFAYGVAMRAQTRLSDAWNKASSYVATAASTVADTRAIGGKVALAHALATQRVEELQAAQAAVAATTARLAVMGADTASAGAKKLLAADTARLTAAEELLTVATEGLAAAEAEQAALGTGAVLSALGGPLAVIVTLLGAAATAWWMFGANAEDANEKARRTGEDVLANLREHNRLAAERNRLEGHPERNTDAELDRLRLLHTRAADLRKELGSMGPRWAEEALGNASMPVALRMESANRPYAASAELQQTLQEIEAIKKERQKAAQIEAERQYQQRAQGDRPGGEEPSPANKAKPHSGDLFGVTKGAEDLASEADYAKYVADRRKAELDAARAIKDVNLQMATDRDQLQANSLQTEIDLNAEAVADAVKSAEGVTDAWQIQAADRERVENDTRNAIIDLNAEAVADAIESAEGVTDAWLSADKERAEAHFRGLALLEEAERGWLEGATDAVNDYADRAMNAYENIRGAVQGVFAGLEDTMVQFVTTGKTSFADLVNSILADLARIAVRQAITGPLVNALGSALGGTQPAIESPMTTDIGAGVSHAGGPIGGGGPSRRVALELFAGARRYHAGGGIEPGEVPIIAQTGEGMVSRRGMRTLEQINAGELGGGAPTVVNEVHVHTTQAVKEKTETALPGGGKRLDVWLDELVAGNVMTGGRTAQAIQSVYGLARAGRR